MTNELLKQLALEARELTGEATKTAATPKAKPSVEFTITLAEYPDLIVTRKQPKVTKHLVILFTAGTAFIKTESTGKSVLLTPQNYAAFVSGMDDLALPDGYWTARLKKGKAFGELLCDAIGDKVVCEAAKRGYLNEFGCIDTYVGGNLYSVFKHIPKLLEEFHDKPKCMALMKNNWIFCADIVHRFGIQNARDFMNSFEESLLVPPENRWNALERDAINFGENAVIAYNGNKNRDSWREQYSAIPAYKMTYDSFKNYVLYSSVRFGYGDSMKSFFREWEDTLYMQNQIYGKVKEKYPDNLPTYHNQLAYKARLMREEIDERNFAKQVEVAKAYEGSVGDYVFLAPKQKQDFYDEATAQANCLASYIRSFTDGRCIILFMRRTSEPERSYITIEVSNGIVRQAKLAFNKNPDRATRELIDAYVAMKAAEA
jgi:hypothetical protein